MVNNSEPENSVLQKKLTGLLQPGLLLPAVLILTAAVIVLIIMLLQKPAGFGQRSDVAATVNGEIVTMAEFFDAMYDQGGRDVLKQLITRRLIEIEAEEYGISISDEMLDNEIASIIDERFQGSEEEFLETLEIYGIEMQNFRDDTRLSMLVQELAMTKINITDDDIRSFLEDNPEKLYAPSAVRVRHILVETREKAEEIIALLDEGRNFEDLAAEYSIDLFSRNRGGNLDFISRGSMDMNFENAAFALDVGEKSGPVETPEGYHVIEVLEYRVESLLQFEDVKDEVRKEMVEERLYRVITELVSTLLEEAEIEYFVRDNSD